MLKKISFCGLGHLGLVYLSVYSNFSKKIVCFDENIELIGNLNKKQIDIDEPGLTKQISKNFHKFKFTNDIKQIEKSDLIFLSLDVPTNKNGKSDYDKIFKIIKKIKKSKLNKTPIIILSQLFPGFCDKISKEFKNEIYYQVETLVFGEALSRAKKPERIIVGSKNKKIENKSFEYLLSKFKCPKINMDFMTAEMTKISINILLISTAMTSNYLSILSEKIGFDWSQIAKSLRLDKRIGKFSYLSPSLGLAGGNLERDLYSLQKITKQMNLNISIINSWKKISDIKKKWITNILDNLLKNNNKTPISLLGLSYKENTNSIKNSNAIYTSQNFLKNNFLAFDPLVKSRQIKNLRNIKIEKIDLCLKKSTIIIISNSSKYFFEYFKKKYPLLKNKIVIDPYDVLKNIEKLNVQKRYIMGKKNA